MEYGSFLYSFTQTLVVIGASVSISLLGRFIFSINAIATIIALFLILAGITLFVRFFWLVQAKNKAHVYVSLFTATVASIIVMGIG